MASASFACRYGVETTDYETVGAAFLWALQRTLGDGFSPAVQAAWASTYQMVAEDGHPFDAPISPFRLANMAGQCPAFV